MAAMVEKMLPDVSGEGRYGQITVDTWFDRLMKALTVWLPLLVSGTLFLGEITGEPQNVFCYPPSNFTIPQANYLNGFCKESLVSENITATLSSTNVNGTKDEDTKKKVNLWTAAAEDKSTEAAETLNLHELIGRRLAADQNSDADSGATGSAAAGRTHDVEADIHPQPPSPGSSSSFHTEDETRPKGPTGEETVLLLVPRVYHRGCKNKSNQIEKETTI
ncbi:pannexin [Branchiostoma belcheri]|nr:pannexin [Branchiostoma belcheri]